jgi:hypothetical protein
MAVPSLLLINALRKTASKLRNGVHYSWGHHGACNCGNLLQTVTHLSENEILRFAHTSVGEWTELAEEYCPVTNAPVNMVISELQKLGLNSTDVHHIEYLNDKKVLQFLEGGFRWLKHNKREDAIAYFEAFANMLEEELLNTIKINFEDILPYHSLVEKPTLTVL